MDAKIYLDAMGSRDTIKDGNESSSQNKAKAMIFLRYHIYGELKIEYLTIKDPLFFNKTWKKIMTIKRELFFQKLNMMDIFTIAWFQN